MDILLGIDYEGFDCLFDPDPDGDGIPALGDVIIGTHPLDADSDDDCVLDGAELEFERDTDGDGMIDPLDPDSDDDRVLDGSQASPSRCATGCVRCSRSPSPTARSMTPNAR